MTSARRGPLPNLGLCLVCVAWCNTKVKRLSKSIQTRFMRSNAGNLDAQFLSIQA